MLVLVGMKLPKPFAKRPNSFGNNFSHMTFVSGLLINFLYVINLPVCGSKMALINDGTDECMSYSYGSLSASGVKVLSGRNSKALFMIFCALLV